VSKKTELHFIFCERPASHLSEREFLPHLYLTNELKSASIMTLSTSIKILLACFAVASLVLTAMSGDSKIAGLKGSGRKLQLGRPKIIKKRNDSLIMKPGDRAQPQLDSPQSIKMRNDSLIIKTRDGTATTIVVNAAGNAAAP
jgi:hypothetical protein